MSRLFDIAVVGAGPTGSVAAYLAARRGLRVALVDKAQFPRDKVCGDGISPATIRLLHDIGLSSVVHDEVPIRMVDLRGPDGAKLCGDLASMAGNG